MNSRFFDYCCLVLVLIGAINWGLVGFFKFDLVKAIFGNMTVVSRIIYAIIGLAADLSVSVYYLNDDLILLRVSFGKLFFLACNNMYLVQL